MEGTGTRSNLISINEVSSALRNSAGKPAFLDLCRIASHGATVDQARFNPDRAINDLASSNDGLTNFVSASTNQFSYELDRESAFTRALIEGLSGSADLDADGMVSTEELGLWLRRRVAALTDGRQTPLFVRSYGSPTLILGVN